MDKKKNKETLREGRKMKLNIGGHEYTIEERTLKASDSTKELYGSHLVKDNVIFINKDIAQSRRRETLIHEVLHAVFYNRGIEHDEPLIETLSNGLHQLGIGDYLWKKARKKS
jgi:Zn-dependent peptidase ImmA (M78 family)